MCRSMLVTAAAGAICLVAASGSALAQYRTYYESGPSFGVTIYPDGPRFYGYRYGPRVYGYYRYYDEPDYAVSYPRYRGGCGVYRYWDGWRCVDSRRNPNRDLP